MIRQLEDELAEYDKLKSGKFRLPTLDRLDQIAPFIVKLRIAKSVSQTGLAKRLARSKHAGDQSLRGKRVPGRQCRSATGNTGRDRRQGHGKPERLTTSA